MKIEKRNGFRQQFVVMHRPYQVIACGLSLLILTLSLIFHNTVEAGTHILAEAPFVAITLDKSGLEGDELAAMEKLEKRFKKLPAAPTKEEQLANIRAAFPGLFDENGNAKVEFKDMAEMLGNTDKGLRSILLKQGEEITALKGQLAKEGGSKLNIRGVIEKNWKNIEETFKSGRDSKAEVVLNLRAPAVMKLDNTITGDDLLPEDLIENFSIGAFVPKRYPREYVFDMASRTTVSEISQYRTWLEEGDEQGAFAIVAEGGLKPLVSYDLVRNFSEYSKVAAKYVVTEELAKFRKNVYAIIKRLISQKILRDYAAILTTRLLADAAPYTASALDGQYVNPTDYHAIAAVAAQIESLNFTPDMLIMNPQDKWRIGMLQDNEGRFLLQVPQADPTAAPRIMGFTVRTSNRVPVGSFLLGEAGLWEIEDEALTVRIGYGVTVTGGTSNGGGNVTDVQPDFDHNRFRVIVETFFHSWIATNNEGSFVYADFEDVKESLQSV